MPRYRNRTSASKCLRPRAIPPRCERANLHVLDIENLVGGSECAERLGEARLAYDQLAIVRRHDHFHCSTGPTLAPHACFAFSKGRFRIGRGLDGADDALTAELRDVDRLSKRYATIFLASGDWSFAAVARDLRSAGAHVVAVVGHGGLSRDLEASVDDVLYLFANSRSRADAEQGQ